MAQAFETVGRSKRNGAARDAIRARANDVIEDFSELRKDVSRLADAASKAARDEVKHTGVRLSKLSGVMKSRASESAAYVGDKVREHPGAAVGIAVGAGLLLGLMLSGRRH